MRTEVHPMIHVEKLSKSFGRKVIFDQIRFTAEKGEITCLIGINGVGKTTLLKAIANLTPVNSGQVTIDGEPLRAQQYRDIVFIPDVLPMAPSFSIQEAIDFMKDFYPNWNNERCSELLTFFRLDQHQKLSHLSKGNVAKVNLVLGLSVDSCYILMDEPFSGIDIFSREEIASLFSSGFLEDKGILVTTHEIRDIEHLIDKAVLLKDGTVVKEFYTEDLRLEEGKSIEDVMRDIYINHG